MLWPKSLGVLVSVKTRNRLSCLRKQFPSLEGDASKAAEAIFKMDKPCGPNFTSSLGESPGDGNGGDFQEVPQEPGKYAEALSQKDTALLGREEPHSGNRDGKAVVLCSQESPRRPPKRL